MPKFSVVIPTHNRPETLFHAIYSVANQEFTDYELIIQDNACDGRTLKIVKKFSDLPIIYNRSDVILSHRDNWEQAIKLTTGDYVTVLGDDDALMPDALMRLDKILSECSPDLTTWSSNLYYWPDIGDARLKNTLMVSALIEATVLDDWNLSDKTLNLTSETTPPPSYTYWICSKAAEHNWYTWANHRFYVNINHGIVSRKLINQHYDTFSCFFIDPILDYGNILSSLHLTDRFLYIKHPITMNGHSGASAGGTHCDRSAFNKKMKIFCDNNKISVNDFSGEGHMWMPSIFNKWLQRCKKTIKGNQDTPPLNVENFLNWAASTINDEEKQTKNDCIQWIEQQSKEDKLTIQLPQQAQTNIRPRGPHLDKTSRARGTFIDGDIAEISNISDAIKLAHAMSHPN